MAWVKIDDGFIDHPKIARLSDRAFRVHIRALCYSAQHLTDGFLPASVFDPVLNRMQRASRELRDGLWTIVPGGYQVHDYLHYNPSKNQVLQRRASDARRQMSRRDSMRPVPTRSKREEKETVLPRDTVPEDGQQARAEAIQLPMHALTLAVTTALPDPTVSPLGPEYDSVQTPEMLFEAWNRFGTNLPQARVLTKSRATKARQRLSERRLEGQDGWNEVICKINNSPFCTGGGDRGWRATFDWLLRPETAVKVLEGQYTAPAAPAKTLANVRAVGAFLGYPGAKGGHSDGQGQG